MVDCWNFVVSWGAFMNHKGAEHINWYQRLDLERMLKEGFSKPQIAAALGKCLRSIYYEIERGTCRQQITEYEYVDIYCPEEAERKYQEDLRLKGPGVKMKRNCPLAKRVEGLIADEGYSPGAALAKIRNNGEVYSTEICETTLYSYIYRGDVFMRLTPDHLLDKGRRHYAAKSKEKKKAARAPRGASIDRRPKEIKKRGTFGHWEMDSVMGCKGSKSALIVLTERKTRIGYILPVPDHTAASVVKALNSLERKLGKLFYKIFKSITVDNGCEFQDFEGIEMAHRRKGKRTLVFYCHPYSAYERGSNENMNRLIRRFFPKGTNFDNVTKEQIKEVEKWMNDYPRKILGWRSAADLFAGELQAA